MFVWSAPVPVVTLLKRPHFSSHEQVNTLSGSQAPPDPALAPSPNPSPNSSSVSNLSDGNVDKQTLKKRDLHVFSEGFK